MGSHGSFQNLGRVYIRKPCADSVAVLLSPWPVLLCQDDASRTHDILRYGLGRAGQGRVEGPGVLGLMSADLPGDSKASKVLAGPLQRLGNKTEIAHSVLYLASPLASYVTGALLVVDGGTWLTHPNDVKSLVDFASLSAKL